MKPLAFTVTSTLVTLALSVGPTSVWAQGRPGGGGGGQGGGGGAQGGGTRENSGGGNTGTAVSRGGGNAGESGSSGGSSVGSSGGSSGSGWSGPTGFSGGGSSTGVSRPGGARVRGEGGSRVDPRSLGNGQQRGEAIPRGARPNPGNPVTGTAVAREGRPPSGGGGNIPVYPGYYPPYWGGGYGGYYGGYYPYWGYPYGWSGLYFYSPFWWGYGYPFDYAYGYGYGGYGGYGGYAGPSGYAYGADEPYMQGSLKLKVKPREAEVFADGYFVGRVDDFDGTFQELNLKAGGHRIEIRAEGFEPITFEVQVDPRQTITYRGELKKVK